MQTKNLRASMGLRAGFLGSSLFLLLLAGPVSGQTPSTPPASTSAPDTLESRFKIMDIGVPSPASGYVIRLASDTTDQVLILDVQGVKDMSELQYQMWDPQGKVCTHSSIVAGANPIDMTPFPAGKYHLRIIPSVQPAQPWRPFQYVITKR
jgi:hypothetical protein